MRISRRDKFASIYFAYIQEYLNDTPSYKDTCSWPLWGTAPPHPLTMKSWKLAEAQGLDNTETSDNQRLWSASNNDRRSKCFCSSAVLCISFMWQNDGQNMHDQITSDRRSKRAWSKCVLCIPYILSGSPNRCLLHTCDSCIITTWRLGLRLLLSPAIKYTNNGFQKLLMSAAICRIIIVFVFVLGRFSSLKCGLIILWRRMYVSI